MRTFLAAAFLVVMVTGADPPHAGPSGYGAPSYGAPSYGAPSYGPRFDPRELSNLFDYIKGVQAEETVLNWKTQDLVDAQKDLIVKLNDIVDKLQDQGDGNDNQTETLKAIAGRIQAIFSDLHAIEARIIGESAGNARLQSIVSAFYAEIDLINVVSQPKQDTLISTASLALDLAFETLTEKIQDAADLSGQDIASVQTDVNQLIAFVNTRHCYSEFVRVHLDEATREGESSFYFPYDFFTGSDRPVIFCGLQGYVSEINLGQSQKTSGYGPGYGYGASYSSFEDEVQALAVSVACKATSDEAIVYAFDQSRGAGNVVNHVYVEVKACSFSAQAGFEH